MRVHKEFELYEEQYSYKQYERDLSEEEKLDEILEKYGDNSLETDTMKFIWGIKAYDEESSGEADLDSLNDIELLYYKDKDEYVFDWEGIYDFPTAEDAVFYYRMLIKWAKKWMVSNGYEVKKRSNNLNAGPCHTVEEAYWKFYEDIQKEIKVWSK